MKVLLLQPNYDAHIIHPPLGLGYLASFLRKNGHMVSIFDGTLEKADPQDYLKKISSFHPDLVGISVLTRGHNQSREIISEIKNKYKKLPVVIGGTQVTAAPIEVLSDLKADFGVVGEGELTLLELVNHLEKPKGNLKKINGLAYKKNEEIVVNKPRGLIDNLDTIPFLAWDLMPPEKYRIVPILEPAKAFPIAPIMTSRGCPYNCSFCASNITWGRKIRFRSPKNVIEEINLLKKSFGVREIHFADDNFTMDIKRAQQICELMISEKINLPWQCPNGVRIDRLSTPLIEIMKKSGCYAVGLGIESGNQEILKKLNKSLDLRIVPQVLKKLKKIGIETYGFFILGLPEDTPKTIKQTINFALENSFDRAWFNIFTPYPGSSAFNAWLGKRSFNQIDWEKHDCSTAVSDIPNLTFFQIERLQKAALIKFYLRPKIFFKTISRIGLREVISFLMSRFSLKIFHPILNIKSVLKFRDNLFGNT